MFTVAVLITCHNRKLKTLECLSNLYIQEGRFTEFNLDVFLVDDASTDGTSEEIRKRFPEVNLIKGDGNLFWNRGMHLAWTTASNFKDFDYYLWLNDDTYLFKDAIHNAISTIKNSIIICGVTKSSKNSKTTYGGYKTKTLLIPNGELQEIDYFNGNFVLVPNLVFKKTGNLDPIFSHALGDFDYGRRAKEMGFKSFISTQYVGFCELNTVKPLWLNENKSFLVRIKYLYSPLSGCNPFEFFVADSRSNGFIVAIFHFISIHITVLLPKILKVKKSINAFA